VSSNCHHLLQVNAVTEEVPVDVAALLARKAVEDAPVDNGSGKLTVWVVKDFKKVEVDRAQYGYVSHHFPLCVCLGELAHVKAVYPC
jgi:hypothetical protein